VPAKRPLTVLQILARRRNARLSTGPRTTEGRQRVRLNRRRLELPPRALRQLERLGADQAEFQRVWRDLLAIFRFMGTQMEPSLGVVAWDVWLKQFCLRQRAPGAVLRGIDARLEKNLSGLIKAYQLTTRRWKYRLRWEFGPFIEGDARRFRMALEVRLPSNQELARQGKFQSTELEDEALEVAEILASWRGPDCRSYE